MTLSQGGLLVGAYLVGSIPTGYWLGLAWKGVDIRQQGSGNLGATNVFRVLGATPGILTLVIDILKGLFTVVVAKTLFPNIPRLAILAGLTAIVGHVLSLFVHFKGGKGVATSAGVFAALLPWPSLAAFIVFGLVFGATRYVSLGSILGVFTLAISSFVLSEPPLLSWGATAVALFVVWTHRANIQRLWQGKENRIAFTRG